MDQNHNILKPLRDLEILPPDALTNRVMQEFDATHPNGEAAEKPRSALTDMTDWSVPPPEFLQERITQQYKTVQIQNRWKAIFRFSLGIAATIGSITLVFLLYRLPANRQASGPSVDSLFVEAPAQLQQPAGAALDTSSSVISKGTGKKGPAIHFRKFYINGEYAALIDNDPFLSFLDDSGSFNFTGMAATERQVRLDEYTFFTMSPRFLQCIGEARETRRNGKLTFRAKLMRRKLEKAHQKERGYFQFSGGRTPLNPFDLDNLINK